MKIVLLFGTFNPITKAHIRIGQLAQKACPGAKIVYIPARDAFLQGWKGMAKSGVMDGKTRLELMQRSLEPYGFVADDIELSTDISGKTFDTVAALREKYHADEVVLCFGTDKVSELHRWYRGEELVKENRFLIITRGGETLADLASPFVREHMGNFTEVANEEYTDVSATAIRNAYILGHLESVREWVPDAVYDYLSSNKGGYGIMDHGFRKAACATFDIRIGDVKANRDSILAVLGASGTKDCESVGSFLTDSFSGSLYDVPADSR